MSCAAPFLLDFHRSDGLDGSGTGDVVKIILYCITFLSLYLYVIKIDGLIVYVPKKFDLSSVFKLEKLFSLTPFCLFAALTV